MSEPRYLFLPPRAPPLRTPRLSPCRCDAGSGPSVVGVYTVRSRGLAALCGRLSRDAAQPRRAAEQPGPLLLSRRSITGTGQEAVRRQAEQHGMAAPRSRRQRGGGLQPLPCAHAAGESTTPQALCPRSRPRSKEHNLQFCSTSD